MDFLLKQRLIGAVVLVALGVIFIPMFLEGPREAVVPDMQVMPKQQVMPRADKLQDFQGTKKVLPLPPLSVITEPAPEAPPVEQNKTKPMAVSKPEPKKSAKPVVKTSKPEVKTTKPEPAKTDKPSVQPEPAQSTANTLGSWVIQAGSFGSQKNAFALRDKLRKAGYPTQVERVVLKEGETYRVRVGPYLDREKAEAKIDGLNKAYQLNSRVMSYP